MKQPGNKRDSLPNHLDHHHHHRYRCHSPCPSCNNALSLHASPLGIRLQFLPARLCHRWCGAVSNHTACTPTHTPKITHTKPHSRTTFLRKQTAPRECGYVSSTGYLGYLGKVSSSMTTVLQSPNGTCLVRLPVSHCPITVVAINSAPESGSI